MNKEHLRYKDQRIVRIMEVISLVFGEQFFSFPDFWDGDNCAIGLIRKDKLVYISLYDREGTATEQPTQYYGEFELIDETSFDTLAVHRRIEHATQASIIEEMEQFLN